MFWWEIKTQEERIAHQINKMWEQHGPGEQLDACTSDHCIWADDLVCRLCEPEGFRVSVAYDAFSDIGSCWCNQFEGDYCMWCGWRPDPEDYPEIYSPDAAKAFAYHAVPKWKRDLPPIKMNMRRSERRRLIKRMKERDANIIASDTAA